MAMGTAAGWRRALADGRAAATFGLPYLLLAVPEGVSIMFCEVGGVAVNPTRKRELSTEGREAELYTSKALAEGQLETWELSLVWTAGGKAELGVRKQSVEDPAEGSLDSGSRGSVG